MNTYQGIKIVLLLTVSFYYGSAEALNYRCRKNKHKCGINVPTYAPRAEMARGYKFFGDADYQHYWSGPYNQINKLFGTSDCGSAGKHSKSAMIGFRHIDRTNEIELLGYVHSPYFERGKYNFAHAHLGTVKIDDRTNLVIRPDSSSYIFAQNSNNLLIMPRACSSNTMWGAKIGTWFGGQRKSPVTFRINQQKFSKSDQRDYDRQRRGHFPKSIKIADKAICNATDMHQELKRRAPATYASIAQSCSETIVVEKSGCDDSFYVEHAGVKKSDNSLKVAKLIVKCEKKRQPIINYTKMTPKFTTLSGRTVLRRRK